MGQVAEPRPSAPPPPDPHLSKVIAEGGGGGREREALIEFDNEDEPSKRLCSTCSQSLQHSISSPKAPLPVPAALCRYRSRLTGSLNTWGPWIGPEKRGEQLSKQAHPRKDGPLFSIPLPFLPNLHICWSGELPPPHLLLRGRSDSEGPGEESCHTVKNYLRSRGGSRHNISRRTAFVLWKERCCRSF